MKLYYFDLPFRGEAIRLLLYHAKVNYKDIRIQMGDWGKYKTLKIFEYQKMPVLELTDGTRLCQSHAVLEYLGVTYGYLTLNEDFIYKAKNILDAVEDLTAQFGEIAVPPPMVQYDENTFKEIIEKFINEKLPASLQAIENKLKINSSQKFMIENAYSIADFSMLQLYSIFMMHTPYKDKIMNVINNLPNLKEYFAERNLDFKDFYQIKAITYKMFRAPNDTENIGESILLLLKYVNAKLEDIKLSEGDQSYEEYQKMYGSNKIVLEENGTAMTKLSAMIEKLGVRYYYLPFDYNLSYKVMNIVTLILNCYGKFPLEMKIDNQEVLEKENNIFSYLEKNVFAILESQLNQTVSKIYIVGEYLTLAEFIIIGFIGPKFCDKNHQFHEKYQNIFKGYPILSSYILHWTNEFYKEALI